MFTATLYGVATQGARHFGWFKEDKDWPVTPINASRPARERFGVVELSEGHYQRLRPGAGNVGELRGNACGKINLANESLRKENGAHKSITIAIARDEGGGLPKSQYTLYQQVSLKQITRKQELLGKGHWLYFDSTSCTWVPGATTSVVNAGRVWVGGFLATFEEPDGRGGVLVKNQYSFDSLVP